MRREQNPRRATDDRKSFVCLVATVLLTAVSVDAHQPSKIPRIGYISGRDASSPGPLVEAFRKGLRELGYIEGKIIFVEYRYAAAKSDVFQRLVTELVDLKVDLIVVPIQVLTAKRLVKTTPIGAKREFGFLDFPFLG